MKKKIFPAIVAAAVFFLGTARILPAAQEPLPPDVTPDMIAKGKELFNSKEGLKVKFACILCHQQEKAIKKSSVQKLGDKLPAVINKHLVEKSKGQAIAADSAAMKALMAYIRYEHSK